ncbi:carbohydrate ABC transporter substrate-binding protein [Clostridiales bacterium COT073_COT-073]|nr:carbohydrate ABC transporter substrate-binding protein [Clostridiales bacterium COT073_COT-073]
MKKILSIMLALLILAGCTATKPVTPSGDQEKASNTQQTEQTKVDPKTAEATIKFSWWGGDSRHEATIAAVEAFQKKYPNIKVETEYGAWSGWEDAQSTAFFSGTAADVVQVNWNWLDNYSGDGKIFADLNNYSEIIDLSQFPESSLKDCTIAEKLQAIPVANSGRIFFWNDKVFEKAGLAVPTTLDELMKAGPVFKEKLGDDYYPLIMGEYDRIIFMVYYLESVYGKPWVKDKTLQYSKEEIMAGLEFFNMLEDQHVLPSIATIAGDGAESIDKNPRWIDGHYGGIFEWDSAFTKMEKAQDDNQGLVVGDYFKDMGEHKGGFAKVSMGLAITETSKNKEAAALLIDYLLNDEEAIKILKTQRGVPASKKAFKLLSDEKLLDPKVADANSKVLNWVSFPLDPKFEDASLKTTKTGVYYEVFENLSYDTYTVEQAADVLIKGINEALGK